MVITKTLVGYISTSNTVVISSGGDEIMFSVQHLRLRYNPVKDCILSHIMLVTLVQFPRKNFAFAFAVDCIFVGKQWYYK